MEPPQGAKSSVGVLVCIDPGKLGILFSEPRLLSRCIF